ncbi:MAG TPA: K(+)-transporting ATPase subunit C [Thermoanaerobaculia bacterium]|nr:K(+)-transporting ATPase subunit C [Thermoanaerobaculia bacterium]
MISVSIRMTIVLLVITCGIYPLAVWAIGQAAFHDKANGSLIARNGRIIGSELIGQQFTSDRYFHPRPSASDYDAMNSGGTNLGPTSKKLRDRIAADLHGRRGVPSDAVTASASGLDPHISPENAMAQAPRVARANGLPLARVQAMIRAHTEERLFGLYGERRVNVLLLNLDLPRGR